LKERALFIIRLSLFQTECDVLIPLYPEKYLKMRQTPENLLNAVLGKPDERKTCQLSKMLPPF
jgi:hypothetical protein